MANTASERPSSFLDEGPLACNGCGEATSLRDMPEAGVSYYVCGSCFRAQFVQVSGHACPSVIPEMQDLEQSGIISTGHYDLPDLNYMESIWTGLDRTVRDLERVLSVAHTVLHTAGARRCLLRLKEMAEDSQ